MSKLPPTPSRPIAGPSKRQRPAEALRPLMLRFKPEMMAKLDAHAEAQGMRTAVFVRALIYKAVAELGPLA